MLPLRFCVSQRWNHIARSFKPEQTTDVATSVDKAMLDCFWSLLRITRGGAHHDALACLPIKHGGCGLPSLRTSLIPAYTGSWLARQHERLRTGTKPLSVDNAADIGILLERFLDEVDLPASAVFSLTDVRTVMQCGYPKAQQRLSSCQATANRRSFETNAPADLVAVMKATTELPEFLEKSSGEIPATGAGAWMLAVPVEKSHTLSNPAICSSYWRRLRVPACLPGSTCSYRTAEGRQCSAELDPCLDHPNTCCRKWINVRHNLMRDTWSDLNRQAHAWADTEQILPRSMTDDSEMAKIADVRVVESDGICPKWYDIAVTCHEISSMVRRKDAHYKCENAHACDKVIPIVFNTNGAPSPETAVAVRKLAARLAVPSDLLGCRDLDSADEVSEAAWSRAVTYVRRTLSVCLQRGNWMVMAGSVPDLWR